MRGPGFYFCSVPVVPGTQCLLPIGPLSCYLREEYLSEERRAEIRQESGFLVRGIRDRVVGTTGLKRVPVLHRKENGPCSSGGHDSPEP